MEEINLVGQLSLILIINCYSSLVGIYLMPLLDTVGSAYNKHGYNQFLSIAKSLSGAKFSPVVSI